MEVEPNPVVGVNVIVGVSVIVCVGVAVGGRGVWVAVDVAVAVDVFVHVKLTVGRLRGMVVALSGPSFKNEQDEPKIAISRSRMINKLLIRRFLALFCQNNGWIKSDFRS